jgi:hypothetical protein
MSRSVIAATAALALLPPLHATVRIAAREPLALAGRDFKPRERVELTVELGAATEVRRVRAGGGGRFEAGFPELTVPRCHPGLAVTALGSAGSRVHWTLVSRHCGPED